MTDSPHNQDHAQRADWMNVLPDVPDPPTVITANELLLDAVVAWREFAYELVEERNDYHADRNTAARHAVRLEKEHANCDAVLNELYRVSRQEAESIQQLLAKVKELEEELRQVQAELDGERQWLRMAGTMVTDERARVKELERVCLLAFNWFYKAPAKLEAIGREMEEYAPWSELREVLKL